MKHFQLLQQVENGEQIIDVNMDDGLIDGEESMIHFLNLIIFLNLIFVRCPL